MINEVIENKKHIGKIMLMVGLLSLIVFYGIRIPLWSYSCLLVVFFACMYVRYKAIGNVERYFRLIAYMATNTGAFFVANWCVYAQPTHIYEAIFFIALYGGALYTLYLYLKTMKAIQASALVHQ